MPNGYAASRFHAANGPDSETLYGSQRGRPSSVSRGTSLNLSSRTMLHSGNESQSISYGSFIGLGVSSRDFSPQSPSARRPSVFTTTSGSRYFHDGGDGPPIPIPHPVHGQAQQPLNYPNRVSLLSQPSDQFLGDIPLQPHRYADRDIVHLTHGPNISPLPSPMQGGPSFADRGGGSPVQGSSRLTLDNILELEGSQIVTDPPFLSYSTSGTPIPLADRQHFPLADHRQQQNHHLAYKRNNDFNRDSHHFYTHNGAPPSSNGFRSGGTEGGNMLPPTPPPPQNARSLEPPVDVSAPSKRCLIKTDCENSMSCHYNLQDGMPWDQITVDGAVELSGNVPSHHQHKVQCRQCHLVMRVSKHAVVVRCPDCDAVSPATNANLVKTEGRKQPEVENDP